MNRERYHNLNGIILKKINYRDTSVIAELFTPQFGKISMIAKGVRKNHSKAIGLFEIGNELKLLVYKNPQQELLLFKNGSVEKAFFLEKNYPDIYLYYAALETYRQLVFQENEADHFFELLKTYFEYGKTSLSIVIFWRFLLKIFHIHGIGLNVRKCSLCGSTENMFVGYSTQKHGFICSNCYHEGLDPFVLSLNKQSSYIIKKLPEIGNYSDSIKIMRDNVLQINRIFITHVTNLFHIKFHLNSLDNYISEVF